MEIISTITVVPKPYVKGRKGAIRLRREKETRE